MYHRRRSAHAGQPYGYTDQRVDVGMGAQGQAPMCRGLGCVPGSMSRRRRAQLASYPGTARGGKTCPDGASYPADVPCPPSGGSSGGSPGRWPAGSSGASMFVPRLPYCFGGDTWLCDGNPYSSQGIPDPRKIAIAVQARGGKTCPDGSSYPADVPCPPSGGSSGGSTRRYRNEVNFPEYYNSGSDAWCAYNPELCSGGLPDPQKIAMAVQARGGKTCPDGASYPADVPCPPPPSPPRPFPPRGFWGLQAPPDNTPPDFSRPGSGESYASQASRMQRRMRR